jgi:hypothetical protein
MSGFQVGVGALSAPAQRLKQVAAERWLADPENDGVRVEMVKIFTALDAAGGQQRG